MEEVIVKIWWSCKTHYENEMKVESHLVDERSEAVVEGLDLFFLLGADGLDVGVNLQVEWLQQTLVHRHSGDGSWDKATCGGTSTEASTVASTVASTEASTKASTVASTATGTAAEPIASTTSTDAAAAEAVAAATATALAEPRANTRATCAGYAHPAGTNRDIVGRLAGVGLPHASY